ncbi:MAG: DUF456 domain-containing protein [Spirochaetes bacterium]|nr:DUF456 domain-containing protein [Spirochaetota bacterium]
MEYVLITLGVISALAGLAGCIIPALPGPPLSFLSLMLLHFARDRIFSAATLVIFGILTLIVTVLDYLLPALSAKWYGVSSYGIWGSLIGMVLGILFLPPVGMVIGIFLGATIGELAAGKEKSQALKAGFITFMGNVAGMAVKLSLSIVMTFYFILYLFK